MIERAVDKQIVVCNRVCIVSRTKNKPVEMPLGALVLNRRAELKWCAAVKHHLNAPLPPTMTSWIDCSLNDYFETVPMERASYTQFINSMRERIVTHCTSETNFEDLDSVLYKRFKEKLSDHAPRSASRRFAAKKIWNAIKTSCLQEQYQLEKAQLAQHLKNDYLTLLTETREVVTDDMGDYINEHGGSSSSNSIGNNSSSIGNKRKASSKGKGKQKAHHSIHQSSNVDVDNEDPFNDHTPSERARTSILKYRAGAQHVSEIHKQE